MWFMSEHPARRHQICALRLKSTQARLPYCVTFSRTAQRHRKPIPMSFRTLSSASPLYVVMLGLLSALPPLGIDMGLPGIPSLQAEFGVAMAKATQTLTLFLLGFSLGPVLFGPLSDRYGRKPVLLFGVALFSVAALGCAMAGSIDALLGLRIVQGMGAGAAAALPAAIVRDTFQGQSALSRQSYVALVNGVAPLVAPLIGAAILTLGDWRSIYGALAIVGGLLFLFAAFGYAETAPGVMIKGQQRSVLQAALASYKQVLANRQYRLATGLLAATFGTMFSYIASSSAVFMDLLGASASTYGLLFAFTALGGMLGAACNGRFSVRLGTRRLLAAAVVGGLVLSLLLLAAACMGIQSISVCALCVVLSNFCAGIVMPSTTHLALKDMGAVAGSAAALQRALQMVMGAAAGAMVGFIGGNSLVAMAASMTLFAVLAFGLLLIGLRTIGPECS